MVQIGPSIRNRTITTSKEQMKIYIGFDSTCKIASDVCEYSLRRHSDNLDIGLLEINELKNDKLYWREYKNQSTEFTYTRFLVPYLQDYKGWAIFCDNDFLFLEDVKKLMQLKDESKAVMVVKHEYNPTDKTKMDNQLQTQYPKKNWSSLMLINCEHEGVKNLTLSTVSEESAEYLHQFKWLKSDDIGSIPHNWNWLVNHYHICGDGEPKALHFTEGGPWIVDSEYKDLWLNYKKQMEENT